MRNIYIILTIILLGAFCSCSRHKTISKQDLARIYYDMYMTDEAISQNRDLRRMTDSLHLYEPIFNKYGYTTEDYLFSVNQYLQNPDKYKKIFEQTKNMLLKRKKELDKIYTYETRFDRLKRWKTLDSLETFIALEGGGESFFKSAKFLFDNIDPKPVRDTRKFSLEVDRPDLDSLKARALIADSLARIKSISDSILADSLFRMMYYIDTTLCDTLATDSISVADSLISDRFKTTTTDSTIYLFFSRAYMFEIDTTEVSEPVIADSLTAKTPKVYYSRIAEFILRDSALMKNVMYRYDYNVGYYLPESTKDKTKETLQELDKKGSAQKKNPNTKPADFKRPENKSPLELRQEKMKQMEIERSKRPMTARDSARIIRQQRQQEEMEKRKQKEESLKSRPRPGERPDRPTRPDNTKKPTRPARIKPTDSQDTTKTQK